MIKEIKTYTLICDRCGKDICKDTMYSSWNEKSYLRVVAKEEGWILQQGEDICDDCYAYNDNDELEINDKRIIINLK